MQSLNANACSANKRGAEYFQDAGNGGTWELQDIYTLLLMTQWLWLFRSTNTTSSLSYCRHIPHDACFISYFRRSSEVALRVYWSPSLERLVGSLYSLERCFCYESACWRFQNWEKYWRRKLSQEEVMLPIFPISGFGFSDLHREILEWSSGLAFLALMATALQPCTFPPVCFSLLQFDGGYSWGNFLTISCRIVQVSVYLFGQPTSASHCSLISYSFRRTRHSLRNKWSFLRRRKKLHLLRKLCLVLRKL